MADYLSQFTGSEIDARLAKVPQLETGKQDKLVSGSNIKTVNGQSILGSGNIEVQAGDTDAVKYVAQTLTEEQKAQARANIDAASLADIADMDFVTAASLPTASASTMGHIYLIGPDANDNYDRYFTQQDGSSYSWVSLGSTQIDLSTYATKAEVTQLEAEANTGYLPKNELAQSVVTNLKFNSGRTAFQSTQSPSLFVTYCPVNFGDKIRIKANTTGSVVFIYGFCSSIPADGVSVTDGTRLEDSQIGFDIDAPFTGYFAFYCVSSAFINANVTRLADTLFAPNKVESHILGIADFLGIGNTTIYSQYLKTLIPGHTYRFYLENWVKATSSSYHIFAVWSYDSNGAETELFYVRGDASLSPYYDVAIPSSGFVSIRISGRISSGVTAKCHIMDITPFKPIEQEVSEQDWKISSHISANITMTGEGNTTIESQRFTDVIPGHTYRIYLLNWVRGTTGSYHQFGIWGYDTEDAQTTIISVRGDFGAVKPYYDFTIPDGIVSISIYGRISTGVDAKCYINDISAIVNTPESKHLNICLLGNSYTADAWRYVPAMLLDYGITCKIEFYYRGSGSLWDLDTQWTSDSQYDIANEDGTTHIRLHFSCDSRVSPNWSQKTRKSAKDIIESGKWDIVEIQQRGNYCRVLSDYSPWLQNVIDKILTSCPYNFDLWWFSAYNNVSQNSVAGRNQESLDAQKVIYKAYPFAHIIPAASAVFGCQLDPALADLGDSTYKHLYSDDNNHLQEGLPCYVVACSVVQSILQKMGIPTSVMGDQFRPTAENIVDLGMDATANGESTGVTEENCRKAQKEAVIACRSPFDIQPPIAPEFNP